MENTENKFKPTAKWMEINYQKLNQELFNGELGNCILRPFTKGKGANGNTLGWFKITRKGVKIRCSSRRMFFESYWGDDVDITRENFYEMCQPVIELNANYSWFEEDMLATLAHEMCHYYTYMNGVAPKQGHGPEFRSIGELVSSRSNGRFTIQRLASAEQVSRMELDADIKAKNEKRIESKKARLNAIFVFTNIGRIEMTLTSSQNVIDEITKSAPKETRYNVKERGFATKIISSNDPQLIEMLYNKGYRKSMRTYRFWHVEDKPWVKDIETYNYTVLYGEDNRNNEVKSNDELNIPKVNKILMFKLMLTNGNTFEMEVPPSYFTLKKKVQERFPNMKDEVIDKILNNPKNYYEKMDENKYKEQIIENVINNFLNEEFNTDEETVSIDPEMNLGLCSPLEFDD